MKKIIITILVVGLLVGASVGYYMWNKPKRTAEGEQPVAVLDADNLLMQFVDNEAKANSAYLNKTVQVNGKVVQIEKDPTGLTVIYLETSDIMATVSCTLVKEANNNIAMDDSVSVKGICTGVLTDVVLTQCVLVQ